MKLFHRQVLRMLPAPFFGWLGVLMFLLLMQFLIRFLPELVGKGLSFSVIVELIAYNLAYMLVLAVPMSSLIASLMAFGQLAESNRYLVIKGAGVSLPRLLWPVLVVGLMLTAGMWYFNNEVLPEANFRAKNLWQDIRRKRPAFQLQPGAFYDGINGYGILVQQIPADSTSTRLVDVLIYDHQESPRKQSVIKAKSGLLEPSPDGSALSVVLEQGQLHQRQTTPAQDQPERYQRLAFERFRMRMDLSDFDFVRSDPSDGSRSDRTMRTKEMKYVVDSLSANIAFEKQELSGIVLNQRITVDSMHQINPERTELLPFPVEDSLQSLSLQRHPRIALAGLSPAQRREVYDIAQVYTRTTRTMLDDLTRTLSWEAERRSRFQVEIHKKNSIALACLIFMFIGAPLGLSLRRGGLGASGALAVGIFLFYWVTLVQGEKLADRGMLSPWVGMWIANLVMIVAGAWLLLYVALDLHTTPGLLKRLRGLFQSIP